MTRRPARPVRALCHVRRRRPRRAVGGVGRDRAGGRRGRAAAGAAGRRARDQLAGATRRRCPSRRAGDDRLRGRVASPIPRGRAPPRSTASRFTVAPGETVALVGPSGAGKSTIFNLLLRFYDPQSGSVRVDGVDRPRPTSRRSAAARIALVPQDVALFADTVAENIRYGAPEASDAEVRARRQGRPGRRLHPRLPQGYDTTLGERGVTLSGGQRQRIAHRPRHPARRADPAARRGDQRARRGERGRRCSRRSTRLMQGRTTLVIAHRLATVQQRRPHPGAGRGPHRRGGHARRAGRARAASTAASPSCSSPLDAAQ